PPGHLRPEVAELRSVERLVANGRRHAYADCPQVDCALKLVQHVLARRKWNGCDEKEASLGPPTHRRQVLVDVSTNICSTLACQAYVESAEREDSHINASLVHACQAGVEIARPGGNRLDPTLPPGQLFDSLHGDPEREVRPPVRHLGGAPV